MIDLGRAQLKSIHPVVSVPDSFGCYKPMADADPAIVYSAVYPYTYAALTVKTLSLKFNVAATKAAVPCLKCKNPLEVHTKLLVEIMLILWYVSEERGEL